MRMHGHTGLFRFCLLYKKYITENATYALNFAKCTKTDGQQPGYSLNKYQLELKKEV